MAVADRSFDMNVYRDSKGRTYPGLYQDADGSWWVRPWVNGRRTWRKLSAVTLRHAIEEQRAKTTDHARAEFGAARSPFASSTGAFASLASAYLAAGCPNRRLEQRPQAFCDTEASRLKHLVGFFGATPPADIRLKLLPEYRTWRSRRLTKAVSGDRTVDLDLATLSNVLNWAVSMEIIDVNKIRSGRPRFRQSKDVSHSRDRAPASADVLHRIASYLLDEPKAETTGWLCLFGALTGCRISELRRLRIDAAAPSADGVGGPATAGFIKWSDGAHPGYLHLGRRSKSGINPRVKLTPEVGAMLDCFLRWHADRHPDNRWFFPHRDDKTQPITAGALTKSLRRTCRDLGLPHIAAHGLRSFYVTVRRCDRASDSEIAAEIGDKTVQLISQTYGDPAEHGIVSLSWLPSEGFPAWARWADNQSKIVAI